MKLKTKIMGLLVAFLIGAFLSSILSYCLVKIFSRVPLEILEINSQLLIENAVFNKAGRELFILILLAFMLLMLVSVFKVFDLDDYLSKTYTVTPDIKIPLPVGKNQTQQGSAWWLPKKELYNKPYGVNVFDPENSTIAEFLSYSEKQKEIEKIKMQRLELLNSGKTLQEVDKIIKRPEEIKLSKEQRERLNQAIFKEGGICVGKKDRKVMKPYIKKLFGKIPFPFISFRKVEDIFYMKDDMHSLTIGATRSGKTRCLVLESIANTALAGENLILSDPKGELFEYTSGALKNMGYNVLTLDFKSPLKSSKYNFLQPVIEQVEKGDIPKALNYCSDIVESLVGEVGNREAIWVNGEKSVIKAGIMAVVMGNGEDKVTDEKIKILYDEDIKNGKSIEDLIYIYKKLSQKEKDKLRNTYLDKKVLMDFTNYVIENLSQNHYFKQYLEVTDEKEFYAKLRDDFHYKLDEILKEFNNADVKDEATKNKMREKLKNWKVLNDLRPHTEYQNLPNVYNFISKMCAENERDKTMLMDTYLDSLPQTHPAVTQFAPARIAPSKTRASFFTSALATLSIFVDEYVANMINESEIDINEFNEQKTALFMILPDEKTTFYGLCSLFVNQCYVKLVEIADSRGGRLKIRTNFILDEFGNFSAIPNFGGFLTVGRW